MYKPKSFKSFESKPKSTVKPITKAIIPPKPVQVDIPEPSSEQSLILNAIELDNNVSISSCPGSGKTTTILLIGKKFPGKRILQVTYNSQLKCEVREKSRTYNINNLEIHSYHSLAVKYYDRNAHTDQVITKIINENTSVNHNSDKYDIIVIDECQDKTHLYFSLICKFINDVYGVINRPQIVLLGDINQCIYKFKGADDRYLSLAHDIWSGMSEMSLTVSYRVTHEIAEFINRSVIGYKRLTAVKHGPKVEYIQCSPYRIHKYLAKKIVEGNYRPDDIFVLCPSVKNATPCRTLENELVSIGYPCYVPIDDSSKIDDSIIEGKVVFTTFHQSKGRERPVVIIYGFDDSYFKYFAKDEDPFTCPSTLYVAISRASKQLILVADEKASRMPFLKDMTPSCYLHINTIGNTLNSDPSGSKKKVNIQLEEIHNTRTTELVKFIKDCYLLELSQIINDMFEEEYSIDTDANIQSKVQNEEVSDLNGIAIPCIFQGRRYENKIGKRGGQDLYDSIVGKKTTKFINTAIDKLHWPCRTNADYLYLANLYQSASSGMHFKLAQITNYDWLTDEAVSICCNNIQNHVGHVKHYELPLGNNSDHNSPFYEFPSEYGIIRISGVIDAFEEGKIWEFKCVDCLQLEHFVQTAIYQWIWNKTRPDCPATVRLFNIRTGEIYRYKSEDPRSQELLDVMVNILLKNKYNKESEIDNDKFLERCKDTLNGKKNSIVIESYSCNDDNDDVESDFIVSGGCLF